MPDQLATLRWAVLAVALVTFFASEALIAISLLRAGRSSNGTAPGASVVGGAARAARAAPGFRVSPLEIAWTLLPALALLGALVVYLLSAPEVA